ncbi:hypothetical protein AB1Y20_002652 [Prymnesium parvum]|uniref:Tudor domain-containing protein n=1 Tax=Prymnesium parvum TaxID=97485 RepID=A0AB34JB10_PRYPA
MSSDTTPRCTQFSASSPAATHKIKYDDDTPASVGDIIAYFMRVNGTSDWYVGQVLKIPKKNGHSYADVGFEDGKLWVKLQEGLRGDNNLWVKVVPV